MSHLPTRVGHRSLFNMTAMFDHTNNPLVFDTEVCYAVSYTTFVTFRKKILQFN